MQQNNIFLFLDDERIPVDCATYMYTRGVDCRIYHKEWRIVRSYGHFVEWITENGLPEFISFDHDLSEREGILEPTGMDCAKWLVNYCLDNNKLLPKWAVHSANPAGYDNIKGLLLNFEKQVNI